MFNNSIKKNPYINSTFFYKPKNSYFMILFCLTTKIMESTKPTMEEILRMNYMDELSEESLPDEWIESLMKIYYKHIQMNNDTKTVDQNNNDNVNDDDDDQQK